LNTRITKYGWNPNGIYVYSNDRFVSLNQFYKTNKLPTFENIGFLALLRNATNNVWIATTGWSYTSGYE
jgi:hypothetical protein